MCGGNTTLKNIKNQLKTHFKVQKPLAKPCDINMTVPRVVTKAPEYDYCTFYADFMQRYPALTLPAPDLSSIGPTTPAKRTFASRKNIASQEQHIFCSNNGLIDTKLGIEPPLPLQECVETFLSYKTADLQACVMHAENDNNYPDELQDHFAQMKETYVRTCVHFMLMSLG